MLIQSLTTFKPDFDKITNQSKNNNTILDYL